MFENLSSDIKKDEELDERLNTSISQHLQSFETVFKQYFPELKKQEAAFVKNPFSTSLNVTNIPDELQDQFYDQGCRSLLSIEGDNLQFYPNFALFSTLGGMNLDHDFVQVSKLSEDQKKGLHQKRNTFFPKFR